MSRYAFSDIHGNLELFRILQQQWKPDDEIYFLGDAADRGLHGLQIMKELLADERIRYIKGNHEQLLADCFLKETDYQKNAAYDLWLRNGGITTVRAMLETMSVEEMIEFAKKIQALPLEYEIWNENIQKKIILCHAGYTPGLKPESEEDFIWNRWHLHTEWPRGYDDMLIIHGHTPVHHFMNPPYRAHTYASGHKIDIDCGTYNSGCITLLNLDTMMAKQFKSS